MPALGEFKFVQVLQLDCVCDRIESESLKRLKVDKCVDLLNLSVATANLESFIYCGDVVEFGIGGFPSLQEADLDFGLAEFFDVDNGDVIINLLSNFHFGKSLRVCAYVTQVFCPLEVLIFLFF